MAKLERPLFGEYATGTLARALGFRHATNWPQVAKLPGSHCPPSQAQAARRSLYGTAARAWLALSDEDRLTWQTNKPANLNGFNFFLRLALREDLFYLGYCAFGSAVFQLAPSPNQPAAVDYDILFPATTDEFPTMVDGAHSFQAWLALRMYSALETIETFFVEHRTTIEG